MSHGAGRTWRSGGEGRGAGEPLWGVIEPANVKGQRSSSGPTLSAGKRSPACTVVSELRQSLDSLVFRSSGPLRFFDCEPGL